MSYFIARPRALKVTKGSLQQVRWPTAATAKVELIPHEVFGYSEKQYPRTFVAANAPVRALWNSNTGEGGFESSVFFDELDVDRILPSGVSLSMRGHFAEASLTSATEDNLTAVLGFLEFDLPAFLSLLFQGFVGVTAVTGTVGTEVEFRLQLRESWHDVRAFSSELRDAKVARAIDLSEQELGSESRYLYACLYYQQAMRLNSSHECRLPALHVAEVVVNLAKCLEILFPGGHDSVRQGCRALGYSSDEVEHNIIPLLIIRNDFDIAHPVAARVRYEDIRTVYKFVIRSQANVRSLLLRVGRCIRSGNNPLAPLSSETPKRRVALCEKLRAHMEQPSLPDEDLASAR